MHIMSRILSSPLVVVALSCGLPNELMAQSCFGPWQPSSVEYRPPASAGALATLAFGPPACAFAFDESWPWPPEVTIVGSQLTLQAGLSDTTGIGVPTEPALIEVPIAPLPVGTYQLRTQFAGADRAVNTTLPLVVGGGAAFPIPVNQFGVMVGLALMLVIGGWLKFGSDRFEIASNARAVRGSRKAR